MDYFTAYKTINVGKRATVNNIKTDSCYGSIFNDSAEDYHKVVLAIPLDYDGYNHGRYCTTDWFDKDFYEFYLKQLKKDLGGIYRYFEREVDYITRSRFDDDLDKYVPVKEKFNSLVIFIDKEKLKCDEGNQLIYLKFLLTFIRCLYEGNNFDDKDWGYDQTHGLIDAKKLIEKYPELLDKFSFLTLVLNCSKYHNNDQLHSLTDSSSEGDFTYFEAGKLDNSTVHRNSEDMPSITGDDLEYIKTIYKEYYGN